MSIRSFVALPLSQIVANQLGDLSARMAYQDKSRAVRWVDQESYHLTLAFLGEQDERDLDVLAQTLDEALHQPSFEVSISGISPFPQSKPKLIAALVDQNEILTDLHRSVVSSIRSVGLRVDKRRFNPHITLGRYRHSRNTFTGSIPMSFCVDVALDEVVLCESTLTSHGAEYQTIFRFPLDEFNFDEI